MKKISFLLLTLLMVVISCKKETKPAKTTATSKGVAKVDNTKFGMANTPKGLAVGTKAPDVALTLADGSTQNLSDIYKKQPVVLFFYRAYWCPVCNKHLSAFAKEAQKIEEKGVTIIAVTPESYDNVAKTRDKTGLQFTIVSDTDDHILKAFDVAFEVTEAYQQKIETYLNASIAKTNANGEAILPVPATFIIDKTGTIVYRQFDPNYKNRAGVAEIIAHLPQ